MSKHTPGPWYYSKHEEIGSTHFYVAQVDGAKYTPNYSDVAFCTCSGEYIDIQEANARLIAAAPDLLKVLDVLLKLHDSEVFVADPWDKTMEEARVAIAKATGEE